MITQSFNCDDSGVTYTDFLLVGRELNEDVVSMGWTDPNLREGCKFLRHLIQQSPHLHQKHKFWRDPVCGISIYKKKSSAHLSVVMLKVAQLKTLL